MKLSQAFLDIPLAHRGLHDELADENSLKSFQQAIDAGYGIEIDVHLLKDGTIAVFHDRNLKRMTGIAQDISALTLDDRKNFQLPKTGETFPLLEETLSLVDGQVPLLIELKVDGKFNPTLVDQTIKLLADYPHKELVALQSFNPFAIRYLRKNFPHAYAYGQLISDRLEGYSNLINWFFKTLRVNKISKPDFIAYNVEYLPNKKVEKRRLNDVPVLTWTVNSEQLFNIAENHADNIIFETIRPLL